VFVIVFLYALHISNTSYLKYVGHSVKNYDEHSVILDSKQCLFIQNIVAEEGSVQYYIFVV
jgi:hypothetical protein